MNKGLDKVLCSTEIGLGKETTKENKTNMEGSGMNRVSRNNKVVTVEESVLHRVGIENRFEKLKYIEDGRVLATGEGVLCTVESYLTNYLGYDLEEIDTLYKWKDYPRNTDYEISELGLIRNKNNGKYLHTALKDKYKLGEKAVWRLRVTIPGVGTQKVAQVVVETYLGDIPKEKDEEGNEIEIVVGHKNDVTIDNRAENLEYITADKNKTIDWVLRDVIRNGLNIDKVNAVYNQIEEVLENKYGEDFEAVVDLMEEDVLEVLECVDVYKRTVYEIYKYVKYGTGVLSRLELVDGRFCV